MSKHDLEETCPADCGHCGLDEEQSSLQAEGFISELKRQGLRRTPALVALLEHLCRHHHPVTLAELRDHSELKSRDPATIYRLVCKLEELGMLRRLGLHGRSSHFLLALPGHHHDYLVCTSCGTVEEAPGPCGLDRVEAELTSKTGWLGLRHELEFFGLCPRCREEKGARPRKG